MTGSASALAWLRDPTVEEQLTKVRETLAGEAARISSVSAACRQLLQQPGKCLRATLVLISANSDRANADDVISLAVATELLHTATLYHDDVMDEAPLRRGMSAPSRRWGNAAAVYAGGYLMSRSIQILAEAGDDVSRLASRTVNRLWKGQMEEMENLGNISMPVRRYLRIVSNKTGALFELSCRVGGHAAGRSPSEVVALARFGRKIGVAFQVADDLSDLLADVSSLGKEPGTDLREGVFSFPIIHCLSLGTSDALDLEKLLRGHDRRPALEEVRAILERSGSLAASRQAIAAYVRYAEAAVMPLHRLRDGLIAMSRWLEASNATRA